MAHLLARLQEAPASLCPPQEGVLRRSHPILLAQAMEQDLLTHPLARVMDHLSHPPVLVMELDHLTHPKTKEQRPDTMAAPARSPDMASLLKEAVAPIPRMVNREDQARILVEQRRVTTLLNNSSNLTLPLPPIRVTKGYLERGCLAQVEGCLEDYWEGRNLIHLLVQHISRSKRNPRNRE